MRDVRGGRHEPLVSVAGLTGSIDVPDGQTDTGAFRIDLRVKNQTDRDTEILNPDFGKPPESMQWPWSEETYRASIMLSFHYLTISVTDKVGRTLPPRAIQSWSTPAVLPKRNVAPGESLAVPIPLGDFYDLAPRTTYIVAIEYGDAELKVAARSTITTP